MRPRPFFFLGLALALVPALVKRYLLWPFPGAQELESIRWAYELSRWNPLFQILGVALAAAGLVGLLRPPRKPKTLVWTSLVVLAAVAAAGVLFRTSAGAIFRPELEPAFGRGVSEELPADTLVLGIRSREVAKAYPLRLIAYHHQVYDDLAGEPIWVTYCSMCRTGKIFRPLVEGRLATFDLIGAVRYNSIYRDSVTGSFWYQANGRAVAGSAAGASLPELRADQMTLERWLELHPESEVLQPDPEFADGYRLFGFDEFDDRRSEFDNPAGWQWVVGVVHGGEARGWAWSVLAGERLIQDEVGGLPVAVHLSADGFSHRVWDRRLGGRLLDLRLDPETDRLIDDASGSAFGFDGVAEGGELAGVRLEPVASTVEYRHSFERFSGGKIIEAPAGDQTAAELPEG